MKNRAALKKIFALILDIFEVYIPVTTFSIMFVVFLIQIFFRYVFNSPLTWPYEITVIAFIWTTLLGACYAKRCGTHVCFGVIYDSLAPQKQLVFRLLGNAIIFLAFGIALYPSWDYINFMQFQKSTVVRIPLNVAYAPFIVFLLLILGRTAYEMIADLKKLVRSEV
jgi:TRAP-type C4-dicarboxylate transport system permease small subunit